MPNTFFPEIRVKRLNPDVPLPHYAHDGDAGLDLCATEDVTLYPGESVKMGSGVAMTIPYGYAGFVLPRSGLGSKGLVIKHTVGVIDASYRGEIGLTLHNNNPIGFWKRIKNFITYRFFDYKHEPEGTIHVHKGDRVAQLVILPISIATLIDVDELDDTARGTGSFGSTGISGGPRP